MKRDVRKYGINSKRGRLQTSLDPFMPDEKPKEPSLCTSCKTVYLHQQWTLDPEAYRKLEANPNANWITCPACQKIAAGYPEGVLTLSGGYLWKHEDEIQRILKNEEKKALAKNPFERVIRSLREKDKLVIETTDKKLAEHLGRVLHKAHKGELHISWTGVPDICRVHWERRV
jgi:NMD protein affecting ribosome stability and mRNA decay